MKYLSLFSWIGGFEYAIHQLFPDAECVGYSEIDKYAIQTYQKNYVNHVNLWDITQIDINALPDFDLLVGGSPCQDLSIAKVNRKGLDGSRSGLFYKYLEILRVKKPKYFLLENVASMPKDAMLAISKEMWVEPLNPKDFNASKVSAQLRKRYYRTNIPWVQPPEDRGIMLKDIIEHWYTEREKSLALTATYSRACRADYMKSKRQLIFTTPTIIQRARGFNKWWEFTEKSPTLSANAWEHNNHLWIKNMIRRLTPIECERLQCFPDGWTEWVSNSQRYKQLGNAVNTEIIKHIISYIKKDG